VLEQSHGEIRPESIRSISEIGDEWVEQSLGQGGLELSEYSVIEQEGRKGRGMMIRTQGNIYAQDTLMRKVWKIFVSFRDEIGSELKTLKSRGSLLSEGREIVLEEGLEVDFDSVRPELLGLLLDTLEYFKVYKLCIFICNRYRLPAHLGRYLLSIAVSFSPFSTDSLTLQSSLISRHPHRRAVLDRGCVGSVVIHSIFENVNPEYLTSPELANDYLAHGLIFLGYFRKIAPFSPKKLSILYDFFEFYRFKEEAASANPLLNYELARQPSCEFLLALTPGPADQQLMVAALEHLQWQVGEWMGFRLLSKYYLNQQQSKPDFAGLVCHPYLKGYSLLLAHLASGSSLAPLLPTLNASLQDPSCSPAQYFDAVSTSLFLLCSKNHHQERLFHDSRPTDLALWIVLCEDIVHLRSKDRYPELVKAVLAAFRVHLTGDYFMDNTLALVHRGSSIISTLLDKKSANDNCFFA
jgi:hypothetical protein